MTVETTLNIVTYLGDGVADTFPFSWPVYDADHIVVYSRDTTTKVLTLVSDSDYTVTGVGNENGGSVVVDTPADFDDLQVVIARILPLTQDLDVDNQGGFHPENYEQQLDMIVQMLQQHEETIGHTVRGQLGEEWDELPPAPDRAGYLLGFDDDGLPALVDSGSLTVSADVDAADIFNILEEGDNITITLDGDNVVIAAADGSGDTNAQEWAVNFVDDADVYIPAEVAITIDQGNAKIGTGDIAYAKSTAAAPTVFNATTLPATLEAGAWLRVSATTVVTFVAVHLVADGGIAGSGNAEFVRDTIGSTLTSSSLTITPNDGGDTIAIEGLTTEDVRDIIIAAVAQGTGILITDDDPGNTTTIAADPEFIRDTMGTAIVGGVGIDSAVSDGSDTITINIKPDIQTIVSAATLTPTFADNQCNVTALATNLTINNPTGTAVDGHGILIRIKDAGVAKTLTWDTKWRAFNDALPITTVAGKTHYIGAVYNAAADKMDVLGVRVEP